MWIRAPVGSRTSSDSRPRPAAALARARTGTSRFRPGTGDDGWLAGVTELCAAAHAFGAQAVVVSLGVDAAPDDPESPLAVTSDGYRRTGAIISELDLPVVAVHEGRLPPADAGRPDRRDAHRVSRIVGRAWDMS